MIRADNSSRNSNGNIWLSFYRTITSDQLQTLVTFISTKFTNQNIDQLSQTGFCLRISPQTYKLKIPKDEQLRYV